MELRWATWSDHVTIDEELTVLAVIGVKIKPLHTFHV